jgi:hypothetical protein
MFPQGVEADVSHPDRNKPSPQGRRADCRSCIRLQKIEPVSCAKAFALETR